MEPRPVTLAREYNGPQGEERDPYGTFLFFCATCRRAASERRTPPSITLKSLVDTVWTCTSVLLEPKESARRRAPCIARMRT
jgi:hypothetical protein